MLVRRRQNAVLSALTFSFEAFATLWTEGIWEIVRATQTATKFLLTDGPVTFYNKVVFPSEWNYPNDVSLKGVGTRTIFPLGLDSCLILTHLEFARKPSTIFQQHPDRMRDSMTTRPRESGTSAPRIRIQTVI
jgi:hypothetical protein